MSASINFKDQERLLHHTAIRVLRRVHAAGARSVTKEDIFQELAVAWCKARDNWNPNQNVPFVPYLMNGMMHHINRWVNHELRQFNIAPFALDASVSEDGTEDMHQAVPDHTVIPADDIVVEKDLLDYLNDPLRWRGGPWRRRMKLSERARQFIQFLANPPVEMLDVVAGLEVRGEFARARGVTASAIPKRVTLSLIFDLMGATRFERASITKELARLCQIMGAPRKAVAELFGDALTEETSQ